MKKISYSLLLFLLPVISIAQYYNPSHYSSRGGYKYKHAQMLADSILAAGNPHYIQNECMEFYTSLDSINEKMVFKSVSLTTYKSDSAMHVGIELSKHTTTYNAKGQSLVDEETDDNTVTSRTIKKYDNLFRETEEIEYEPNDKNKLVLYSDEKMEYDARGNIVKDISQSNEEDDSYTTYTFSRFDSAGNEIETRAYSIYPKNKENNTDTNIIHTRYDKLHRIIYREDKGNDHGRTSREYHTFDEHGNETLKIDAGYDSVSTESKFDSRGNTLSRIKYINGKVTDTYTVRQENGRIIETDEQASTADVNSCPNNSVSVTTSDTNGNMLSEVTTVIKNGHPFVTTTSHKYLFAFDRVLVDTCTMTSVGYLYSNTSIHITRHNYDENGNETEFSEVSGGEYSYNTKWENKYNDVGDIVYSASYNACNDAVPQNTTTYEYYPNSRILKKKVNESTYVRTITLYLPDSRLDRIYSMPIERQRENSVSRFSGAIYSNDDYKLTVYTYEPYKN